MALKPLWDRLLGKAPPPEAAPPPPNATPAASPPNAAPAASPPDAAPAAMPSDLAPPAPSPGGPIAAPPPAPSASLLAPSPATEAPPPATQPASTDRPPPAPPPAPIPPPAAPAPSSIAPPAAAPPAPAATGWFGRLRAGLSRSTARLTESVTALFQRRRLDDAALEELEETLIAADLGVAAASRIVADFRRTRFGTDVTAEEVKEALAASIATILAPVAQPLVIDPARKPHVILVVGVNGTGKTTTIAKLGQHYRDEGRSCTFVAGDTFRAAAVEQLQIWAERTGAGLAAPSKPGADAAGLAFDALTAARAAGTDVLLIDTAGRLHNKSALMEELKKVIRIIKRVDETAPHSVLLVLDATTGQNAVQQTRIFSEMVAVTGLAVTKLDGSAKGGVVVALAQEFAIPVHVVGVGETAADLRPFEAGDFARGLMGLQ